MSELYKIMAKTTIKDVKSKADIRRFAGSIKCMARYLALESSKKDRQKPSDPCKFAEYIRGRMNVYENFIRKKTLTGGDWIKIAQFQEKRRHHSQARFIYQLALRSHKRNPEVWHEYIKMEMRLREWGHAIKLFKKAVSIVPHADKIWWKYIRLLEASKNVQATQQVFDSYMALKPREKALKTYIDIQLQWKQIDKAREIYQYLVQYYPKLKNWMKYAEFEENHGFTDSAQEICKNGIRFYVEKLINYASFEELEAKNVERCRQIYDACMGSISPPAYVFSKIWLHYAEFEIRQQNLIAVKKALNALNSALEECFGSKFRNLVSHDSIQYRRQIHQEIKPEDLDKCRRLYEKILEFDTEIQAPLTWRNYAELEQFFGKTERARAIYEKSVCQPRIETEILWKAYIDLEISQENLQKARQLYERGNDVLKSSKYKSSRASHLEDWYAFEKKYGNEKSQAYVASKIPRMVKRKILYNSGTNEKWGEISDYVFPEEEDKEPHFEVVWILENWTNA